MQLGILESMQCRRGFALISLAAMTLAGCATSPLTYNEGVTRVGYGKLTSANKNEPVNQGLYLTGEQILPKDTKDSKDSEIIGDGDAFSVRLISAFICDFRELSAPLDSLAKSNGGAQPCPGGDGGQHAATRGEIAILAKVGERDGSGGLTFDPADINKGRVVYYNEDVRETGQLINALNLPVYGPITYHGKPFYMDWTVMELDNAENAAARNLLKTLSAIGTLSAAPATPTLALLNSLGDALINANGDDVELRFQMEMDAAFDCSGEVGDKGKKPDCMKLAIGRMPLREGYYAFVRGENRSKDVSLSQLSLCQDKAALCVPNTPSTEKVPAEGQEKQSDEKVWRDKTWLLVRIARENKSAAAPIDNDKTLAVLMASRKKMAEEGISLSEEYKTKLINALSPK